MPGGRSGSMRDPFLERWRSSQGQGAANRLSSHDTDHPGFPRGLMGLDLGLGSFSLGVAMNREICSQGCAVVRLASLIAEHPFGFWGTPKPAADDGLLFHLDCEWVEAAHRFAGINEQSRFEEASCRADCPNKRTAYACSTPRFLPAASPTPNVRSPL
jgi:hypothetical protein